MVFVAKKAAPVVEPPTPGTWWPLRLEGGVLSASFTCPFGHFGTLTDHYIDADGTVQPSVICPEPGCGFHEVVRLEGWGT